jgi:hypothetical protein
MLYLVYHTISADTMAVHSVSSHLENIVHGVFLLEKMLFWILEEKKAVYDELFLSERDVVPGLLFQVLINTILYRG